MTFTLTRDDYYPCPPGNKSFGIGMVGCGSIVQGAHLPAYRAWEYRVVACCDLNEDAARQAAEKFAIPQSSTRLEDVLDHPDVEIIDLAVHASQRLKVVEQIASHSRKPRAILSQKPLALQMDEARRIVEVCQEAGIVLAVNQQQRWTPPHRALKWVIDSGMLGHVYSLVHFVRGNQDTPGSWYIGVENFNIVDHGIHFIDLSRHFLGRTPIRVKATTTTVPEQNAVTPMIYSILCEYESSAQVMSTLHFNNIVSTPQSTGRFEWLVDGTRGSAILNGDKLEVVTKDDARHKHTIAIEQDGGPIAFAAAMGELMQALDENRAPVTAGRDNLNSIGIAYAAVQSSNSGEAVRLDAN
jgi:predicted dehydrogenase